MNNKTPVITFLTLILSTSLAISDTVYNDDLIVTGNMCTGFDCVNNLVFGTETLRIRENNARVRFIDSSSGNVLGQSWMMVGNGNNDGGKAYFQFEARSLSMDTILFSDGSHALLDCTTLDPVNGTCANVGQTPVGEPVLVQEAPLSMNTITSPWYTLRPVLHFGDNIDNSVAIGGDSTIVTGAISVGKTALERRIVNVAIAIAGTDLATIANIEALTDKLDTIDANLGEIERAISALEGISSLRAGNGAMAPYTLMLLFGIFLYRVYCQQREGTGQ